MKIAADKNQFSGSHGVSNALKHKQIELLGHSICPIPLPYGDYCLITEQMQETIDRRGSKLKKADLVGDIKVSVDSKKDLLELCGNICSSSHARFRDEVILSQKCGCKLYILVEESNIKSIQDVFNWKNPRNERYNKIAYMHKYGKWLNIPLPKAKPTSGQTLAKAMLTMELKYGVTFKFCSPKNSGEYILNLLTDENI